MQAKKKKKCSKCYDVVVDVTVSNELDQCEKVSDVGSMDVS